MLKKIQKFVAGTFSDKKITLVSGLPRSGTSLMMKMLESGGMSPLTDHTRTADGDNPKGYYEYERVKALRDGDTEWLSEAKGKVVKIIFALLPYLPSSYQYNAIFMRRSMPEIIASQKKMLRNRGEDPDKISGDEIAILYEKHMREIYKWVKEQPNFTYIEVAYNDLIKSPRPLIHKINDYLGSHLIEERMVDVIDPSLYRHRNE